MTMTEGQKPVVLYHVTIMPTNHTHPSLTHYVLLCLFSTGTFTILVWVYPVVFFPSIFVVVLFCLTMHACPLWVLFVLGF